MPADYALMVCSQKGGVGKTTVALNLAAALSTSGPISLLDSDPLHCVSGCVMLTDARQDLGGSNGSIWPVQVIESMPDVRVLLSPDGGVPSPESLRAALDGLHGGLAVIDSPPLADPEARKLLSVVSGTLVIESVDPFCLRTLPLALESLLVARAAGYYFDFWGVLPVCMRGDPEERGQAEALRMRFGENIRPETLPFEAGISAAQLAGKPLAQTLPESLFMQELGRIAQQIREQTGK